MADESSAVLGVAQSCEAMQEYFMKWTRNRLFCVGSQLCEKTVQVASHMSLQTVAVIA